MRTFTLIAISALLLSACSEPSKAAPAVQQDPIDVSIYQLVVTPERFHGKLVRVMGYIHLEFEGNGLYPHQEDFERSLHKNGVWINVERCGQGAKPQLNDAYVLVEGIFSSQRHGHMGLWSGELTNVTRCVGWSLGTPGRASNKSFKPTPLRGAA